MGDLDPAKVKAAVAKGLALLEPLVLASKNEGVASAWNNLVGKTTPQLLQGEISVDEWKTRLGQFGVILARSYPSAQIAPAINATNEAAQIVEEAFTPPSSLKWLIFAGLTVTGLAYWWTKRQESEKKEIPILHPDNLLGTRRKAKIQIAEPEEEEEAEFEEIS